MTGCKYSGAPKEGRSTDVNDDLISRKALKEFILKNGYCYANTLDTFPTVDPVKHGKWVDYMPILGVGDLLTRCSACGLTHDAKAPFCPYCGARMDGGDETL